MCCNAPRRFAACENFPPTKRAVLSQIGTPFSPGLASSKGSLRHAAVSFLDAVPCGRFFFAYSDAKRPFVKASSLELASGEAFPNVTPSQKRCRKGCAHGQ